jgi:hypothetical protein
MTQARGGGDLYGLIRAQKILEKRRRVSGCKRSATRATRTRTELRYQFIATEPASLAWLANLAGIELHHVHSRTPHLDKPDYIVYDLDPPEDFRLSELTALAREFKDHVESFGYHAFVKTTGRKGLNILTPIEPKWDFSTVFDAAKTIAEPFVTSHSSALTLQLKKEHRKGKGPAGHLPQPAVTNHYRGLQPARPTRRLTTNWVTCTSKPTLLISLNSTTKAPPRLTPSQVPSSTSPWSSPSPRTSPPPSPR